MNPSSVESISVESLISQVADEYLQCLARGEQPQVEEYAARYPQIGATLRQVLPALQLLRQPVRADVEPSEGIQPEGPLGDFRIVREIGRGGMGIVYEAVQVSLGRRVALKVLPFAAAMDAKQLQRFKNEAQAAAHLHHTNIVPVHAVGCERGVHFYAMQYIEGQTLAAVIRELRQLAELDTAQSLPEADAASALVSDLVSGRWAPAKPKGGEGVMLCGGEEPTGPYRPATPPPHHPTTSPPHDPTPPVAARSTEQSTKNPAFFRTVAQLGIQAAEALEHAHQLGVIHRDIKPANLLVDGGGRLWVTDFGLAHCQSQPGLTMTGDLVGTLRYMSPEQALAKRVTVDARTDVYSLGVTLYELLTLEPAYNGRNREEVLRQIAFEEPRLPSRLNKAVPAELETVALKAMARNPDERYGTALELADDLRRFLEDKPIRAKRPSLWQRAAKWARRHKTVVRAAVAVLLLAVLASAVSTLLVWRANEGLDQALKREQLNSYYQRIALAEHEWSANDLSRVQQLLDACPADLRDWEWYYLRRMPFEKLFPLKHPVSVLGVAFSPDGRWIASGSQDGVVTVWNVEGQKQFAFQAHKRHVRCVAFRSDGQRLATASWDKTAKVWEFDPQRAQGAPTSPLHTLPHPDIVNSVVFSPDGQRLASATDFSVRIWDIDAEQQISELPGHGAAGNCLVSGGEQQYLASASGNSMVTIWDWRTGQERHTLRGHDAGVVSLCCSRDGRWLAASSNDGRIKIWNALTGQEVRTLLGHGSTVYATAFNADGKRLASGGEDETLRLWDLQTGQEVLTLRRHRGSIRSLDFSPDGNRLVSAGLDKTVRIWDARPLGAETGQELVTLASHAGWVFSVAFSPDGRWLASIGDDGKVRLWDHKAVRAGATQPLILDGCMGCKKLAFSHHGRFLATGGGDNTRGKTLKVWASNTWEELVALADGESPVAFSADDRYLVTAISGADFCIQVRDPTTGQEIRPRLRDHTWQILDLAFSPNPDMPLLASACVDATVRIWDVTAGKEIQGSPLRHTYSVRCVAFSHDGQFLASGGIDRIIKIWDTHSWLLHREWPDPTGTVQSARFHPNDNRILAWGSRDGTVKVWHTQTDERRILHGHRKSVEGVAFSPDGEWIASASRDGTVKIWKVPPLPE
jgi:WD40 repeat protein/serine/threonine protein kinase